MLLKNVKSAILTEFCPEWIHKKGGNAKESMKKIVDAGFLVKKSSGGYMTAEEMMAMPTKEYSNRMDLVLHSKSIHGINAEPDTESSRHSDVDTVTV